MTTIQYICPTGSQSYLWYLVNTKYYIYVSKLNQTVLELDFRAVKFLFFPRRDLNPHHWYTAAPFDWPYVQGPRPLDHIHSLYIYKISKKRTKRIFHNILVLTCSLLLQIFRYNVYVYIYIYKYIWKLNQTVLELDLWADKFCSSLDGIWAHTIDTLQHKSLSLMSSALDHSTTSAIEI